MGLKGIAQNGRFSPDLKKLDRMLEAGGTGVQAAAHFGVHEDTLYLAVKRDTGLDFSAYKRQKRSAGESLLKCAQFKTALEGNATMLIWLGKQILGQKDKPDSKEEFNGQLAHFLDVLSSLEQRSKDGN